MLGVHDKCSTRGEEARPTVSPMGRSKRSLAPRKEGVLQCAARDGTGHFEEPGREDNAELPYRVVSHKV